MGSSQAQLSTDFYKKACRKVFAAVKSVVAAAVAEEKRMGASLLRLHFHDCFVQVIIFYFVCVYMYKYVMINIAISKD